MNKNTKTNKIENINETKWINKTPKYQREYELNEKGEKIGILDKNGNIKTDKNGDPMYEFAIKEVQLPKPLIINRRLYNYKELIPLGLKQEHIKPLNREILNKQRHATSHLEEDFSNKAIVLNELKKDSMKNNKYGLNEGILYENIVFILNLRKIINILIIIFRIQVFDIIKEFIRNKLETNYF